MSESVSVDEALDLLNSVSDQMPYDTYIELADAIGSIPRADSADLVSLAKVLEAVDDTFVRIRGLYQSAFGDKGMLVGLGGVDSIIKQALSALRPESEPE